jgi:hypothetical protein
MALAVTGGGLVGRVGFRSWQSTTQSTCYSNREHGGGVGILFNRALLDENFLPLPDQHGRGRVHRSLESIAVVKF